MKIIQVTLLATATPIVAQNATQNSTQLREAFQILIIQNNAAAVCRVGDQAVSATKGIALAPTPSLPLVITCPLEYSSDLSEYYLFGTPGNIIDVMYLT
jgi:hypothetical protein